MSPETEAAWVAQHRIDAIERERLGILSSSDLRMARVVEDLLAVLIKKGILAESDLPAKAAQTLQERRHTRSSEWVAAPILTVP